MEFFAYYRNTSLKLKHGKSYSSLKYYEVTEDMNKSTKPLDYSFYNTRRDGSSALKPRNVGDGNNTLNSYFSDPLYFPDKTEIENLSGEDKLNSTIFSVMRGNSMMGWVGGIITAWGDVDESVWDGFTGETKAQLAANGMLYGIARNSVFFAYLKELDNTSNLIGANDVAINEKFKLFKPFASLAFTRETAVKK